MGLGVDRWGQFTEGGGEILQDLAFLTQESPLAGDNLVGSCKRQTGAGIMEIPTEVGSEDCWQMCQKNEG